MNPWGMLIILAGFVMIYAAVKNISLPQLTQSFAKQG